MFDGNKKDQPEEHIGYSSTQDKSSAVPLSTVFFFYNAST